MGQRKSGVNLRIERIESAAELSEEEGLETLLVGARDSSSSVRTAAVNALAWFKGREALHAILCALDDRDELVRLASVEALGIRRHVPSRGRLIEILQEDDDELVRAFAASSLGDIGGGRDALLGALEREESDGVRLRILVALGKGGRRSAVFEAIGFCWADDYRVRCAALNLLVDVVKKEDLELFGLVALRMSRLDVSRAVRSTARRVLRALT